MPISVMWPCKPGPTLFVPCVHRTILARFITGANRVPTITWEIVKDSIASEHDRAVYETTSTFLSSDVAVPLIETSCFLMGIRCFRYDRFGEHFFEAGNHDRWLEQPSSMAFYHMG